MIDRLVQMRNTFERMVLDKAWYVFMVELRRRSGTTYTKGCTTRQLICCDGFWNTCKNFLYMVIQIVKALRVFDGTGPAMGLIWRVMYDLEAHVHRFIQPLFGLTPNLGTIALNAFEA